MDDFRNTTFVLSDEEGNEIEVEIIDTLEHEGKIYVAMMEAPEDPEAYLEEEGEFFIFELIEDEQGSGFVPVEDDALLDTLGQKFEALFEEYDDEDEDDED